MNYNKEIKRLQAIINNTDTRHFITMFHYKADAVRIANHFRGEGYKCKIESGSGVFHELTITKPSEK